MFDPPTVTLYSAASFSVRFGASSPNPLSSGFSVNKGALMPVVSRDHLIQAFVSFSLASLLIGAVLFLSAGTLRWAHGFCFMAAFLLLTSLAMAWLWGANPEIFFARRRLTGQGTKGWDLILLFVLFGSFLAILVVAGLDDGRFHWAPAPSWVVPVGYVLLLAGYVGTTWAQAVNRHFEPSVRIQSDRDHSVVTSGPYAYVRHPGYIFGIALTFGIALALGSLWALLPAALVAVMLAIRTILEDATLQHELSGYGEYALHTRYKWIPGIW